MLHAIGERVADDAYVVTRLQFQFGGALWFIGGPHRRVGPWQQHEGGEQTGQNQLKAPTPGEKTNETHRNLP